MAKFFLAVDLLLAAAFVFAAHTTYQSGEPVPATKVAIILGLWGLSTLLSGAGHYLRST